MTRLYNHHLAALKCVDDLDSAGLTDRFEGVAALAAAAHAALKRLHNEYCVTLVSCSGYNMSYRACHRGLWHGHCTDISTTDDHGREGKVTSLGIQRKKAFGSVSEACNRIRGHRITRRRRRSSTHKQATDARTKHPGDFFPVHRRQCLHSFTAAFGAGVVADALSLGTSAAARLPRSGAPYARDP